MSASLRVGIDARRFEVRSGQDLYLWHLATWLGARGHEVDVLSVRPQADRDPPGPGVRLHRLADLSRPELRRYVADLELDALLINPERARDYRGIHANVLRPGYGTEHYSQKLRSFRSPLVRAARALWRYNPVSLAEQRWERRFYEAPDPPPEVVANSRYTRREVLSSYDIPQDRVHVVYNGIDTAVFSPGERSRRRAEQRERWGIPPDAVCLLFMAHNFRLKGLWQVLDLMPGLRASSGGEGLHLLVAGSGTGSLQVRKAERRIRRHGLEDVVHLAGAVHPSVDALSAADVFLHLSWHDSFSFAVLEAMATGLPVITTAYTGAAELITDGESGLIIHPGRSDEIAGAVRQLLDGDRRRAIGEAAARVGAAHSEEVSFEGLLEVFRLARSRSAPVR